MKPLFALALAGALATSLVPPVQALDRAAVAGARRGLQEAVNHSDLSALMALRARYAGQRPHGPPPPLCGSVRRGYGR